jgi:hypothetical protein
MSKYIEGTHITWDEYKCRHCGALPPDFYKDGEISVEYYMIFQAFELIRGAWGEPITVNSGYRCLESFPAAAKSDTPQRSPVRPGPGS